MAIPIEKIENYFVLISNGTLHSQIRREIHTSLQQMSTETKFESFWTALEACPYDLPQEIKPHLKEALQKAGFFMTPQEGTVTQEKFSGYGLFIREKMTFFKEEGVPAGERLGKAAALWKDLSDDERAEYIAKAKTKFETFWIVLRACPYDIPQGIKPHLEEALQKAGFFNSQNGELPSMTPQEETVTQKKLAKAETKFESFWTALEACPCNLPQEIKPELKEALRSLLYGKL
jgi:hypothetical protein